MIRGQEALDIGGAWGNGCCRSSVSPEADVADLTGGRDDARACSTRRFQTLPGTKTTVLQDWIKGRRSEVDDLNGVVVAERARLGIPTPA